jgi:hypothetical protein
MLVTTKAMREHHAAIAEAGYINVIPFKHHASLTSTAISSLP